MSCLSRVPEPAAASPILIDGDNGGTAAVFQGFRDGGWGAGAHEAAELCESVKEDLPVVVINWTHLSSGDICVDEDGEVEGSCFLDDFEVPFRGEGLQWYMYILHSPFCVLIPCALCEGEGEALV